MTIFNYKIINYKKFSVFFLILSLFVASFSFVFQKAVPASAAITDCTAVAGNLIQNCSFENTAPLPVGYVSSVAFPGYGFILSDGYTGIDNWSVLGPISGSNIAIVDVAGVSPQGNRFVDVSGLDEATPGVDGEQPGSGIEQVVSGLVVGQKYEVSFYHAGDGNNDMNVLIDGVSKGTFTVTPASVGDIIGSLKWVEQRFTFIANSTTATLTFRNDLPFGPNTLELDNIALVAVNPTPTITGPTTVNAPFIATVTFDQHVSGFTLNNFLLGNATVSDLSAPTNNPDGSQTYTVTVTPTIAGTVTISIPATTVISISPIISSGSIASNASNTLTVNYDPSLEFSNVHIQSNNPVDTSYATTNDIITLTYSMNSVVPVLKQTVTIDGVTVTPVCAASVLVIGGQDCTATLVVPSGAPISEGLVTFNITNDSVGGTTTTATTDLSSVTVDRVISIVINTPAPSDDLATFLIAGSCELGAGDVTISGTGFTPNPVTTPCFNDGGSGSFEYEPATGIIPGTISITATQTDNAGNIGTDTNVYTSLPVRPTVTIDSPRGVKPEGVATVSGSCSEIGEIVTIAGSGFNSPGTTLCLSGGVYEYIIVITGNTSISASQTNSAGTVVATTTTRLPRSGSSGGCEPGYPCDTNNSNTQIDSSSNDIEETSNENSTCPVFTQYLKKGMRDGENGISEVSKVQNFLSRKLGITLNPDGVFGSNTQYAVKRFQSMFFSEVLSPWKLSGPTGWWYQSTRSYANFIEGCSEGIVQLDNNVKVKDGNVIK